MDTRDLQPVRTHAVPGDESLGWVLPRGAGVSVRGVALPTGRVAVLASASMGVSGGAVHRRPPVAPDASFKRASGIAYPTRRQRESRMTTEVGYRPTVTAREFLELDVELAEVAGLEFVDD